MRLIAHTCRILLETIRYGLAERRLTLVAVIVIGLILVALAMSAQVVAPLALYPFA